MLNFFNTNILSTTKAIVKQFPKKSRKKIIFLIFGMLVLAMIETIGAGSMAFFASTIADPGKVLNSSYIVKLNTIIGIHAIKNIQEMLIVLSICVVSVIVLNNIARSLIVYFSGLYSANMAGHLSEKLLKFYLYFPYEWHLSKNPADLALTVTWRLYLTIFVTSNLIIASDLLIIIVLIVSIFFIDPIISMSVLFVVGTCFFIILKQIGGYIDRTSANIMYHRRTLNKQANKSLHGIKDIKVFGVEKFFLSEYSNQIYTEARMNALQKLLSQVPSYMIEVAGITMLSISVCTLYIVMDASTVRTTGVISLLAVAGWRVLPAARRIMSNLAQIRSSMPFIKIVLNYLNEINNDDMVVSTNKKEINEFFFQEQIQLEDVSFLYKDSKKYTLLNVNITIPRGKTVGIVGVSGAGKSTLVDIIIGLLPPTSGKLKVDGKKLTLAMKREWIKRIGYVPQFPYLCDGTLAENVAFGLNMDSIDRNNILECCKMAAMDDFLGYLPKGIDTLIGERGVKLSGGQKQRVAIARALYHKPEVLIFDEATSSLDSSSERSIQETIYSFKGKHTLIIIAHRLSTVKACDILVWIENGKVKNTGSPEIILKQYQEKADK